MTAQPLDAPRGFFPKAERDRLLARIDDLEAQVAAMREAMTDHAPFVPQFARAGFTKGTAQILAVLFRATGPMSNEALVARARIGAGWRPDTLDDRDLVTALKVQICQLRRRIAVLGGPPSTIETIYRVGYSLSPQGRQWLAGVLEATQQPAAPENAPTASQSPAKGNLKRGGAP